MLLKVYIGIIPYGNRHDIISLNWHNMDKLEYNRNEMKVLFEKNASTDV